MEWVEESEKRLVLLLLDFEKVFDRINWDYSFFTFRTLGFCEQWIQWVLVLYKVVTSSTKVNREVGDLFNLFRLVWQGCPLSPYLFILMTNVLGYLLCNPIYGVRGLIPPSGDQLRDQSFVDDTTLYL
jgi:hypothetical protein